MQRIISLLLSFTLFLLLLSGCKAQEEAPETGPLRICVDTGFHAFKPVYGNVENGAKYLAKMVASHIEGLEEEDVELEIIPGGGTERKTTLTRIRTEIMSGEGPDVFLCSTVDTSSSGSSETPLFPFPERAMEDGLFLPLDKYLKKAEWMEPDKMLPVAMEAGKTKEGQVILPISLAVPITSYLEGEAELPAANTTFADVVASNDPILQSTMAYAGEWDGFYRRCYFPYLFTDIADYRKGDLTFTEDELFQMLCDVADMKKRATKDLPKHFSDELSFDTYLWYTAGVGAEPARQGINESDDQVMLPVYNVDGGATALIRSFGAVNANTRRPKSAFFVLDYLLSKYMHNQSELYAFFCQDSLPVHMEMGEARDLIKYEDGRIKKPYGIKYQGAFEPNVFRAYSAVRDQISHVRFNTALDQELMKLSVHCCSKKETPNEETMRERISESYTKMQRLLDES